MTDQTTQQNTESTSEATPERVFTQDQVNALLAEEKRKMKAKYADYDEVKAKAAELDETREAAKSDMQRAIERAEKAEKALVELNHQLLVADVATAKGVPAGNLTGTTREELEASADALLAWRGQQPEPVQPRGYAPYLPKSGTGSGETSGTSMQAARERARKSAHQTT